jgi:hypothetical protein
MRVHVAVGTLVFVVGCGGRVGVESSSTHDERVGASDASAGEPSHAPPDAGNAIYECWVDQLFFDAGAGGDSVYDNALYGDPKACGLPSICSMDRAPQALCDHLCGPGTRDCYYTTRPLQVSCASSEHRLVNEWDAGYPCME